jgi:hypothetical protein
MVHLIFRGRPLRTRTYIRAEDSSLVYHWAPYGSLHMDDALLSELQFDVVYDYVFVCHLCW